MHTLLLVLLFTGVAIGEDKFTSLGCWKDNYPNRVIPGLEGLDARLDGDYWTRSDAIEKCYQVALSKGYKVFAVQNGGYCLSSPTADATYKTLGESGNCKADGEGGNKANQVYNINSLGAPTTGLKKGNKGGQCTSKCTLKPHGIKFLNRPTYVCSTAGGDEECSPSGYDSRGRKCLAGDAGKCQLGHVGDGLTADTYTVLNGNPPAWLKSQFNAHTAYYCYLEETFLGNHRVGMCSPT